MRHIFFFLMTAALLLGGCGGGGGPLVPSLTPEQIAQFEVASQHINNVLMEADDPFNPEALETARQAALTQSVVEQAVVEEDSLIIKYKDGGFQVWQGDIPKPVPPTDLAQFEERMGSMLAEIRSISAPVGTREAVVIDGLYDDPAFDIVEDYFDRIEEILEAKSMNVERLNGSQEANVANLKQLSDCSVLVMFGHGGKGVGFVELLPYAVQIGEPWSWAYPADWIKGRIAWMEVPWGEGDEETREKNLKGFVAVTGRFWSHYYENSHFNNGLFLNLACSSSRYEFFRNELFRVGIKGYTGWSEAQNISYYTAWRMLATMADEKTLQQAYDELPYEYKHRGEADLWVGKDDGLDLTLGGPILPGPQITITSPENGASITARTCIVEGDVLPWQIGDEIYYATIAVNGQSNVLSVDSLGNFSHEVGLRVGENAIRVSVITTAERSKEVRVTGNFEDDVFWSKLSWNTDINDIDLRMVPVEGADGKLDEECYFGHKQASWGAELDVDDVNGFGPEHITARILPEGKYLLYVHYWDDHGQSQAAVVSVAVSANSGQTKIYTLPAMEEVDDVWEVCYVTYPAGTIETIDEYIPARVGTGQFPLVESVKIGD